jgi:hypothetical protein
VQNEKRVESCLFWAQEFGGNDDEDNNTDALSMNESRSFRRVTSQDFFSLDEDNFASQSEISEEGKSTASGKYDSVSSQSNLFLTASGTGLNDSNSGLFDSIVSTDDLDSGLSSPANQSTPTLAVPVAPTMIVSSPSLSHGGIIGVTTVPSYILEYAEELYKEKGVRTKTR